MVEWLSSNQEWIQPATSIGTLLVWLFYAQLLFGSYSRQRRPRLLINRGVSEERLDSPCLICNMSEEPIYIYFILVCMESSEENVLVPVTDTEESVRGEDTTPLGTRTRQGPLAPGRCLELTSFRAILERAAQKAGIELKDGKPTDSEVELKSLEFHVVCIYGSDDKPFGSCRKFSLETDDDGGYSLTPATLDTIRRTSWRYKRRIRRWLTEFKH
jgi:hypothetical protein